MEVGVGLPRSLPASRERAATLAQAAERLGFASVWMGEHMVCPVELKSPYPYSPDGTIHWEHTGHWPEAMVTLAYIGGVTETIRIGTSVLPNNVRDPLSLAKQAATVDVLSGGRLELGLGAGWCLEEGEMLGHPSDHLNGRLEETLQILRLAWGEPSFEFRGRFYDFDEVGVHPQPLKGKDAPIWLGGTSNRMVRMVNEHCDGIIITPRRVKDRLELFREQIPDKKVCALTALPGGAPGSKDFSEILDYCIWIRDSGADAMNVGVSEDPSLALEQMEWFAENVLPEVTEPASVS